MFGGEIFLKMENLQRTGAFKIRGATYKLMKRADVIGPKGVVAASAGNHAQGVALAATQAKIPSTIVMPVWASISKQEATRGYGGNVILDGNSIAESLEKAKSIAGKEKMFIHPFDDLDIITGQATIGLEIIEDLPDVDMVLISVGGGGLISGITSFIKAVRPQTKVIGVQSAACPSALESIQRGNITRVESRKSIADGIAVKQPGEITFRIIKSLVEDIVLVEEEEIAESVLMLLELKKILAEGAGAVVLGPLINKAVNVPEGVKTVLVISGGNVDSPLLGRILRRGLQKRGRIMRVVIKLDDIPGALASLLSLISSYKANVLHIFHERHHSDLPIYRTRVELELETRNFDHIEKITRALSTAGYELEPS
jgi:threonine dehydratase